MKILSSLFILVFAILLASCTQTENNISPVAPNLNKVTPLSSINNGTPFPFPLLTTFKAYTNKGWSSTGQLDKVSVLLSNPLPAKSVTFAVIVYSAPGPIGNSEKVLTFLDFQYGNTVTVPVTPGKQIQKITIYAFSNNSITATNYYSNNQDFTNLKVDSWKSTGKDITVTSSSYVPSINQLYAVVNYGTSSVLVFMQKPSSQTFTIPDFGGSQVTSVSLYGLGNSILPVPLGF